MKSGSLLKTIGGKLLKMVEQSCQYRVIRILSIQDMNSIVLRERSVEPDDTAPM